MAITILEANVDLEIFNTDKFKSYTIETYFHFISEWVGDMSGQIYIMIKRGLAH